MIREWIYRCEQFFLLDNTVPEMKVHLASLHMEGKALQWHHNYIRSRYDQFSTWPEYIVDISARFGRLYDDPLADLVNLKQAEPVTDFLDKFECALTRLSLSSEHALSIFLANLFPHLQMHVRQFNPRTLSKVARLAKLYESYLQLAPKIPQTFHKHNTYSKPNQNTSPLLPTPFQSKAPQNKPLTITPGNEKITKKYSFEEIQERKNKGLCMFCEEQYTPGHHLKHKKAQIYVMECEDDNVDDELESGPTVLEDRIHEIFSKDPHISINALNGFVNFNCIRIQGLLHKRNIYILIDPGSTLNFIVEKTAKLLNCALEPVSPLTVSAVGGSKMISEFFCRNLSWSMQGHMYTDEVRTVPLDYCDLVVGIQWLISMGPILWDFVNMIMEFKVNGEPRLLKGTSNQGCKIIKRKSLDKVMQGEPHIALLQVCDGDEAVCNEVYKPVILHIEASSVEENNKEDL